MAQCARSERQQAAIDQVETWSAHNYAPLPVVIASAEGARVRDLDGHSYIDCLAAYSAVNFGHGNPRLLRVAEEQLRDHAEEQEVELALGASTQVSARCDQLAAATAEPRRWQPMRATLFNANPRPATLRLWLGPTAQWAVRGAQPLLRDGQHVLELTIPANGMQVVEWEVGSAA